MNYQPPPKLADWGKVHCGCHKCIHTDYYLKNSVPPNGECLKEVAYEQMLWDRSRGRFEKLPDPFPRVTAEWRAKQKTASAEQMAVWMSWAKPETPEQTKTRKEKAIDEAKKGWETYRFDPLEMEEFMRKAWNTDVFETPKWKAFMVFGKEQYELHNNYKVLTDGIKTKEDYKNADQAYKELAAHIDKHGHIMWYGLKKNHKLPKEKPTESTKVGRRAARRLKNASESSSSTISRSEARDKMVATVQGYMMVGRDE